jgi:hypothetical protein
MLLVRKPFFFDKSTFSHAGQREKNTFSHAGRLLFFTLGSIFIHAAITFSHAADFLIGGCVIDIYILCVCIVICCLFPKTETKQKKK